MFGAYKEFWQRYADFGGTSARPKYWWVVLVNAIIYAVFSIFGRIPGCAVVADVLYGLYGLAVLIPSLAICIRRLRDAGKYWANIFWVFLPLAGAIVLIVLLCQPSVNDAAKIPAEAKPVE